jgi:predicted molibdopterin-dependent oxidoreductase YjgC
MTDSRMPHVTRGARLTFVFDGREVEAYEGETIGMALWAAGVRGIRAASKQGGARGMFCAMGICYECLVDLDERPVRACVQPVVDKMVVTRRGGAA